LLAARTPAMLVCPTSSLAAVGAASWGISHSKAFNAIMWNFQILLRDLAGGLDRRLCDCALSHRPEMADLSTLR